MLLGSLFLYLIWPLIIVVAYVVAKWAIDKFEANIKTEE
jgi:hypothetical protein